MRVTFLGTGTSTGVPVVGCDCATCRSDDPRDRRWRPSLHIELADGTSVLVDAATDLRAQALRFGVDRVDAILFTHAHADHVLGLDEVRRYNHLQRATIPCYGDTRTLADIRRMFAYVFEPTDQLGGGLPRLATFTIGGAFCLGRATVVPVPLWHGKRPILGFRVANFAYLTDCNAIPDASWPLLAGVDVLAIDALRTRPHSTHFSLDQAVEAATRVGASRTYFTHMCHDLPHAATCERLPSQMQLAYDGLRLDLPD
ncbi:MAG: MBL fold metallo-hydrolase [Vicinamibacterales bacterium]|jgi:phosphoribosyl 1,2-cyclic phosphate phosphodiesterase|nr:MBL fold metallo-hydrolase [Acidobacteriota bacterium]MDP6374099.1 MBL fold metallo-hydrolase [Vicinamibacterales bacterium]MDP6610391.1 MBL fold metallo-hydrolase [Vicinamibacterales bacterium]HAK55670.1 MBL fold metallo-hydrolase [Acidobacteriota bacterium]|tara:strand:+ start:1042 stop:1812 length:771 start_codon:yes stop_codon:yes gene_type:complete